jgi:hypothetical protein
MMTEVDIGRLRVDWVERSAELDDLARSIGHSDRAFYAECARDR